MTAQCDSCDHTEESPQEELLASGWQWHDAGKGRLLVICDLCADWYARRRKVAA